MLDAPERKHQKRLKWGITLYFYVTTTTKKVSLREHSHIEEYMSDFL